MTDTLLWLVYLVCGAIAFVLVRWQGWRLVGAMVAATVVGVLLSLLVMLAFPREDPTRWFQVDLAMNGSLSLIFAGAGAAIAYAIRERD